MVISISWHKPEWLHFSVLTNGNVTELIFLVTQDMSEWQH